MNFAINTTFVYKCYKCMLRSHGGSAALNRLLFAQLYDSALYENLYCYYLWHYITFFSLIIISWVLWKRLRTYIVSIHDCSVHFFFDFYCFNKQPFPNTHVDIMLFINTAECRFFPIFSVNADSWVTSFTAIVYLSLSAVTISEVQSPE